MNIKSEKGITLTALIVTIALLAILAGVSITGMKNDGVFGEAQNAVNDTEIDEIKEKIALDIIEYKTIHGSEITEEALITILENYGYVQYEQDGTTIKGIITDKNYEILLADIYTRVENAETSEEQEAVLYIINYQPNGGTMAKLETTKEDNNVLNITNEIPIREGYTFLNWKDSGNNTYVGGDTITITGGTSISLIAQWERFVPTTVASAISAEYVFDGTEESLEDEYGNEIKVPKGFKITNDATTVDKGIVIEDVTAGNVTTDGTTTNPTFGSQFVWIPIGRVYKNEAKTSYSDITLGRYDFNSSTGAESAYSGSYKEDDGTYSNTRAKDISAFKTSVSTNGGYYLGRYEASNSNGKCVTKYNQTVWNNVTQPNAATAARNMYGAGAGAGAGVISDLINSYSWDTAITYIQKCGANSKYSIQIGQSIVSTSAPQTTGTNRLLYNANGSVLSTNTANDVLCNIYDMAGNVMEWSTETSNDSSIPCVPRGGDYNHTYITSVRGNNLTSHSFDSVGFRPLLYL